MGLSIGSAELGSLTGLISGAGRAVADVAGAFTPNAEASAARAATARSSALAQFAAEFQPRRTWFDALIDGVNRIPRPAMALGTIGLFGWAMADPIGFAARMQGVALIPEPMWWLMGAIVGFYFGARELSAARSRSGITPEVVEAAAASIERIEGIAWRSGEVERGGVGVPSNALTPGVAAAPDPELDLDAVSSVNPELGAFLLRVRG
ncbi:Holin of 3TMs, for gene-transfer release [Monaibacterium marinum]|uniref:Holin of 3TMs, for gene-transfer release n=1 Tax=Pontivivens marinum TaxID=1690039 RepID=A0A2C9CQA2_9RHOB|nr:holin family protein [Monaibacterium marinum]SOH93387.1 Holin of 3TMs, for gene-transfer release [Monaibacterium marinum]